MRYAIQTTTDTITSNNMETLIKNHDGYFVRYLGRYIGTFKSYKDAKRAIALEKLLGSAKKNTNWKTKSHE